MCFRRPGTGKRTCRPETLVDKMTMFLATEPYIDYPVAFIARSSISSPTVFHNFQYNNYFQNPTGTGGSSETPTSLSTRPFFSCFHFGFFGSGGVVNCEGTEFSVEPCGKGGWLRSRQGKHRSEVARQGLERLASIAAFRSVESLLGSGWSWLAIRGCDAASKSVL